MRRRGSECDRGATREGRYAELEVRIGLHTGEPGEESDDLLGTDVDLTARIVAEAGGGQIFVSELTRALARQASGMTFAAQGVSAI